MSKPLPRTEDIHSGDKKIKKIIINIHDVELETKEKVAMVTVALDVETGIRKKKIERLNAIMPLNDSKEFQRVIKSLASQMLEMKYGKEE